MSTNAPALKSRERQGAKIRERQGPISANRIGGTALIAIVWLGGLISIFPLVWTFVSSFRPDASFLNSPFTFDPHTLMTDNYRSAFSDGSLMTGFKNTTVEVVIILATTLFFCPLAGYAFAKFEFHGRRFLFGLMMLTLFFVPITQYVPLLLEMNEISWVNSFQALVIPLVISSLGIFWMTGTITGVPNELLHSARVDGCGTFSTWWRIVMPIIRPALVSLAVVTFLAGYNDYFWPLLILPGADMQTIQVALFTFVNALFNSETGSAASWGPLLAAAAVVFLPTVAIFLVMQRYFIRGMMEGSVKQ
jgi:multiple sugar transport system permease protein